MRVKPKGHDDRIGWHHKFTAFDGYRLTTPFCIRLTQLSTQQANASDLAVFIDFDVDRMNIELKRRTLFPGIFELFFPIGRAHD